MHVLCLIMFPLIKSWVAHRATSGVMLDRPTECWVALGDLFSAALEILRVRAVTSFEAERRTAACIQTVPSTPMAVEGNKMIVWIFNGIRCGVHWCVSYGTTQLHLLTYDAQLYCFTPPVFAFKETRISIVNQCIPTLHQKLSVPIYHVYCGSRLWAGGHFIGYPNTHSKTNVKLAWQRQFHIVDWNLCGIFVSEFWYVDVKN